MKKILYIFLGVSLLAGLLSQLDFQKFHKEVSSSCPFCEGPILERQLFLQEGEASGVLTYKPAVPGHVLIIPVRHVERFEELTAKEMEDIQRAIQKIHKTVQAVYGTHEYVLLQKNGPKAGQSVPHLHFHYLPAAPFMAFRFFLSPWLRPLGLEELARVRQLIEVHLPEAREALSL